MSPSPLLNLPPELRNQIYDLVAEDTEQITIRNGSVLSHPFSHVCRQVRNEFGPLFASFSKQSPPQLAPRTVKIQLENFDFNRTVQAIDRLIHNPETQFDIDVRVTKQLHRSEWEKMWSWVHFCDELAYQEDKDKAPIHIKSNFEIQKKFGACNVFAACHEMYIEVVPYILQGNVQGGCTSAGYAEIDKMRRALSNTVAL